MIFIFSPFLNSKSSESGFTTMRSTKLFHSGLYRKFKELLDNKNRFIDESENLYKDAVQKYENG